MNHFQVFYAIFTILLSSQLQSAFCSEQEVSKLGNDIIVLSILLIINFNDQYLKSRFHLIS